MRFLIVSALTAALLTLTTPAAGAKTSLPLGFYAGQTSQGHTIQFRVIASRKSPGYPRSVVSLQVRFDTETCGSGSILTNVPSRVSYGKKASNRGRFAVKSADLSLSARFTSTTAASGRFRATTLDCTLKATDPVQTFTVKRTTAAALLQQQDAAARSAVSTAVAFVESCGAQQSSYVACTTAAVRQGTGLDNVSMSGQSVTSYVVTATSESANIFTHTRAFDGTVVRSCTGQNCNAPGKDGTPWY